MYCAICAITICAVKQTTIYLPDELKQRLSAAASEDGRSEASIVRESLEIALSLRRVRPSLPLLEDGLGRSHFGRMRRRGY